MLFFLYVFALGKDERIASDRESNEEKKALNASYEEMYSVSWTVVFRNYREL